MLGNVKYLTISNFITHHI